MSGIDVDLIYEDVKYLVKVLVVRVDCVWVVILDCFLVGL